MSRKHKGAIISDPAIPIPNDIRYKGIFTYRGLRLFALVLMTLSQVSTMYLFANKIYGVFGEQLISPFLNTAMTVAVKMGQASLPLLVVSSIAIIINKQESFGRMLINYFVMAVIIYLFTAVVLMSVLRRLSENLVNVIPELSKMITEDGSGVFIKSCLRNIIGLMLPGDGTVDTASVNQLIAVLGINFTIPDVQALVERVPESILPREYASAIISSVASLDPELIADELYSIGYTLVMAAPETWLAYLNTNVIPNMVAYLTTRMNIDVYWNLFIYALFYFFITYKPKKLKNGKLMLFRCCSLLPALWLLFSFIISTQLRLISTIQLPVWFVAMLPNARPAVMVIFFLIVLFQKYQELEHAEDSGKELLWKDFRNSRLSSLQFSVFMSAIMLIVSGFDWLLGLVPYMSKWGFGKSAYLWTCIPILMLYTYNKKPKHKIFNAVIPVYYILHYIIVIFMGISALTLVFTLLSR